MFKHIKLSKDKIIKMKKELHSLFILLYDESHMIISFLQTKGGTAKTTLATCLAYSKAFEKAFASIGIVELDPQGTILAWQQQRPQPDKTARVGISPLYDRDEHVMIDAMEALTKRYDLLILDVPGESLGKFATRLAASLSDLVLIPMRSSANDEQSFVDHIYPILQQTLEAVPEKQQAFWIIPTFVHPQTNLQNITGYFDAVMPAEVSCLPAFLPYRGVYENYGRDGRTLREYTAAAKGNLRQFLQAKKAVSDIEKIAQEVLKRLSD
jgi:cellulose biosynthesis protein BcsQ